jgi:hypothetical protein
MNDTAWIKAVSLCMCSICLLKFFFETEKDNIYVRFMKVRKQINEIVLGAYFSMSFVRIFEY